MRLLKFLNENDDVVTTDFNEAVKLISEKCRPFLRERVALYKGSYTGKQPSDVELLKFPIPKHRYPMATDRKLYSFINKGLVDHGFVSRSQSVVCTGSKKVSRTFGDDFLIFPIGPFRFSYCESNDFNFVNNSGKFTIGWFKKLYNELPGVKDKYPLFDLNTEENAEVQLLLTLGFTNLKNAAKNSWEIGIGGCSSFYSLYLKDERLSGRVSQALENGKFEKLSQ